MTVKPSARLLIYSFVATIALAAQKGLSLPFWDAGTNYPMTGSPASANLGGLTNVEGDIWGKTFGGGVGAVDVQVVNYPLVYPGLECSGSNSFLFGFAGTNSFTDRIAINPPVNGTNSFTMTSGTIYYSFIFQIPSLGGDTSGSFFCGFNNLTGNQTANPTTVGSRIYIIPNGSGYQVGIGKQPSNAAATNVTYLPQVFDTSSVNFVVGSYTFVNGSASNDISQIWLNPSPSVFGTLTPPAPDAINTNGADVQTAGGNAIQSFILRQGNVLIPEVYLADLRMGYCWACVTPPASITNSPIQPVALSAVSTGTNSALISFSTNGACFKLLSTTNLTDAPTNWPVISTAGTVSGTNLTVSNTVASVNVVTTNITGGVTNLTTNAVAIPTYYEVKTYNN